MLGKLIALSKNGEEKESLPVVNLHFFIGSDLFCDLRINHKDIAAQHCLITSQKNKPALIRNLSRTVPTLVNNTEIGSSDVELKDNDIIAIRHKNYKWCYDSSTPSTSSQTSYVVTSKNRKSWPLFKNKLVAVVTPQRRDEENEVLPKKRRGTIAEENISKSKSAPKVLAIKSGIRATNMPSFGKRKLSVKTTQSIASIQGTPKELPTLNRKSVKFLDTSAPRSRLGMRGRNGSLSTPYKSTPAKQKVSVYSTPPSSFRQDKKKPIKSILKTPSSSSTTPRKNEYDEQHLLQNSGILTTPLSNVPEITIQSPSLLENELLQTPTVGNQPEIIMRSSRRKATAIRSPPSTPKSITKKRKSPEEKSIEASERAAKKLKKGPPHAIDKKKRAALLKCHRKSLTPHPVARRSGKLIINFPSSLSRRLEIISPSRTKVSPKSNNTSNSEKFSAESSTSNVLKSSSLDIQTDSEIILHNTISQEKLKPGSRKNSRKSFLKGTTPTVRKFTRASRAACISNNLPQKKEATDVLSALDLSRRWPSPLQGEAFGNSTSQDVSNLSGFKKLFSADKTLDVRELFLEKNSEPEITNEKSFQKLPETNFGRISRRSALLKGKQSTDKEELMHSFHSEGAQDQLCSDSLLSGSLSSFPSCSSTSRRSLSLKQGRRSTVSPKDTNSLLIDDQRTQEQSPGKKIAQSSDHVNINSYSSPRKTRRTYSMVNGDSIENNHLTRLSKSISDKLLNMANEISKNCIDQSHFSSPLNDTSRNSFDDCNVSREGLNDSTSDASVFSLGSFNSSYHKSRSGADLSLSQVISDDKGTPLDNSLEGETSVSNKDVPVLTPGSNKLHSRGRISLRRTVLLASTPKPGKLLRNNVSKLSSDVKVDAEETSIHKNRLYNEQLIRNRNFTPDITSGKLKKIMKGKGFIGKTSSRFTSLPLNTDSSVLKDLSAISTSVGNLRASLRNKGNQSGLKLDLLKNSISLIKNNNMDSSVTELSSIQSTSDNLRDIADQSNIEEEPKIVLESHISNGPRRSHRKTENSKIKHTLDDNNPSISKISTINNSIGNMSSSTNSDKERGRISVMSLGHDKSPSIALKKRSRSLPSLTDKKNTHKQNLSISENFLKLRRSNRKYDDKIVSRSGIVSSSSTPLTFLIKSDETINNTPIVEASINTTRRRGRPSKFSVKSDNSQSEKSIILENHSQSLPSLSNYQINLTSEQMSNVLNDSGHLRRSSRRNDGSKILNITSSSLSVLERDNSTISVIQTSPEKSFGRRGRQSKLSFGSNAQFEDSTIIKKRSQSLPLPSASDGQITPKNTSCVLDYSIHLRQRTRQTVDNKMSNKMQANTSLRISNKKSSEKDSSTTPVIQTSPDKSFGRRGRPSELIVDSGTQVKDSSMIKKRSQSLPSRSDGQIMPKTTSNILDDSVHLRRSTRKTDDSNISIKMHANTSSSSLRISYKKSSEKDSSATPVIQTSEKSFGRRGRPSEIIVDSDSQVKDSAMIKKRSQSLPSRSDGQITSKNTSNILDDSVHLRRSTRKTNDNNKAIKMHANMSSFKLKKDKKDINGTSIIQTSPDKSFRKRGRPSKLSIDSDNVQLKKPSTLHNKTESDKEGELSLIMKSPVNTSRGRTSRPSKSSIHSDDPQLEKPTIVDKLNLPSSDNICQPRQSRLKGEDSETSNKALFDSPLSSPTISLERAVSDEDIYATPNISKVSFGPRGKLSKVSVSPGNCSKKSNILKENSLNQGSMSDNQITPMHAPTNLDHSCSLRKNCHQNEKIINNISLNLFDDKTVSKKSVDTPKINNLSSIHTSTRRKGRPKRSVPFDSHTLQPNTSKRRSRSLPSSTENLTTPEPTVCGLDNISHPRRSSRKANVSNIVSLSHSNTPSASLSKLSFKTPDKEIRPNFNILSVGNSEKRSRSYKINHSPTKESIILEKDLQNKMLLTEIKATLKHALGSPEITLHPRRSSRKSNDTLITEIPENVLPTKLTNSDDLASSTKIDGSPKRTLLTLNTSVGRMGRSSKILEFDNRGINKEVTPEQSSSILNNDDHSRRGSRKQDDIKVFQKTSIDELDSDKKVNMSKSLVEVPNVSIGSRGIQSKISGSIDDSKLENSGVVKKRSRSLPSTADGKKLNKSDVVTLSSLQTTLIDETASDEIFATPNISGTSSLVKSSSGKRDKSSKMIVSPNNSQLKGSSILEKNSQNVNASGGKFSPEQGLKTLDNFDPPRRSSRKEIGKVLSKTGMNSSSALHGKPGKEVNTTPKISTTSPVKNIIGKQSIHINSSSELNESYLKKSTVLKKHSQSLTSLPVDQDINVHEYSQHHRRSTRRTVISEISNSIPSAPKTSSSNETYLKKEIIKISDSLGSEASELFNLSENTSVPTISQCKVNKSKKRKFEEFYEGSVPKNSLSFSSSSDDNGFSRSRKKVKINNDSTMFSDSNKRTTYSGSVAGNIKAFVAFSSTPIITKNPYSVNNAGVKNLRSSKFKNMSPMGLSPIMASNETDSSGNKESSQISMICLRHSECPSNINQSDSFVSSSNMLYVEENRSLNSLDVTSGSNSGTNNSKVKFNKKAAKRISTSQDQLPIANQNPDSPHFPPVVKEDKSIGLLAQIKKSCHSKDFAHESLKGEVNNTSFRLKSSKTPVIKLSPGKSVVPSRKKQNNFLDLKNHENSIHENSVEKIIAPPQTDCVSMRETSLQKLSSSNKSTSSLKMSEQAVTSLKSPIARRRGRPPKPKDTSETSNSTNKIVTAAQRRGRSAKNIDSNPKLENTEAPIQKLSKRNKGKKTIPAKDSSCSTKKDEVNVDTTSDRTLSEKVEQNSFVSFPKTRSKVAVSALRTPRKSVIISSPIVKSLSLNRRRVGKSKLEKTLTPPHIQKQGRLAKGRTGNTLEDPNVLIDNSSAIEKNKGKKTRAKNSSQLKKNTDTEKQKDDSSSPVKRRGRSAINVSNGKETQVGTSNIMAKRKVINEVIEEPSTLPPNRRGRSVVKNSNSNKKGKLEQDQENNNKIIASPSLTKKGRTDKVQDIVLSDSVKKTLASENTLRRGRSVPKHSESFKTEKHQNNLANGNETIASFSQSLPKRGRNAKVPLNSAAAINKTARKTSESESSLRRGRSDVKKSDSFMKQAKLKKDTIKNIEMIPSTSLPKEGRSTKKVQVKAVTDSRTKHNNKDSETEEVQTTKKKRGRSAMRENNSELGPEKELITLKSEEDGSLSIDSTLPKRGRSTNRRAKTVSESNESRSTFPLPKRGRQVVENSNSTAKRGKSKKGPTVNNVDNISPSLPKRGRPAKTTNKVLESTVDQNCLQRRGRSAAVEKQSTVMKGKLNKDLKENSVAEISSSKKRGRPAMENGSPTQERSVASKRISPVLERKSKAPAKDILKLPRRRGNTASSPLAEVHKVSERSKAIKKNSKIKDSKPLKSAIKKNLSKRLSRKSSSIGIIKNGRRKVHFNKNVVRNSGSRKK